MWRIRFSSAADVHVTCPTRAGRRRQGIVVHASVLESSELTVIGIVPCTTLSRTLLDLAATLRRGAVEYAMHRAEARGLLDLAELRAQLELRRGAPGTRRLWTLLGDEPSAGRPKSGHERRLARLVAAARLAPPQLNRWIALSGGHGVEVDLCWPERRLAVEVDSRDFHDTRRAFENDRERDRLLMLDGWRVVRYTERQLKERPAAVVAELRALLGG